MTGYYFHPESAVELQAAMDFYESKQAELGREFLDETVRAISHIRQYPLAAPSVSKRSRRCRLRKFPYGLVYQIRSNEIAILAVMHLRRKPEYWLDRES